VNHNLHKGIRQKMHREDFILKDKEQEAVAKGKRQKAILPSEQRPILPPQGKRIKMSCFLDSTPQKLIPKFKNECIG
jgi:hypothetical protein